MDIYFISPHLDDAILSAGALIYELKNQGRIKIITVFTKGDELFLKRKIEDKNVCHYLDIDYLHLDFIDVLWRNSSNSIEEQNLEIAVVDKLKKIISENKDTLIFTPLSIGNHIDHRIVNKICRENFTDVIYWQDYPYNLKYKLSEAFIKKNNLSGFEYKKNLFVKEKLIKFYHSQIPSLFGDKPMIIKKERYYFCTR
jgi:LmbE family N-acetylglucosaminyl deacetylase